MNEKNTDTDRQNQDLARLDGALDAIARVMKETELMLHIMLSFCRDQNSQDLAWRSQ